MGIPPRRKLSFRVIFRAPGPLPCRCKIARMGLFDWLKGGQPPPATPAGADDPTIPRYPPFPRGIPVIAPADVLASQRELIAKLQDGLAFTDERFATLVRPVLGRYAAFVHLLPASEAHHHRGTGGLFRHGLEVAFYAARASQGLIFALERSPGERRALEPRWHLAAGLAGLCHDLGKPIADLAVTDRDGGTAWRPLLESLSDWAAAKSLSHYYLRWRGERHHRHEAFGLLVLARMLTPEVTAWLADPDPAVLGRLVRGPTRRAWSRTCGRTASTPWRPPSRSRSSVICSTPCAVSPAAGAGGSTSPGRACGSFPKACTSSGPRGRRTWSRCWPRTRSPASHAIRTPSPTSCWSGDLPSRAGREVRANATGGAHRSRLPGMVSGSASRCSGSPRPSWC